MARKKITMDRVGEITLRMNQDWTEINAALQRLGLILKSEELKDLHRRYDDLRNQFANLITLGQEETYPFFAQANGVILPDEEDNKSGKLSSEITPG